MSATIEPLGELRGVSFRSFLQPLYVRKQEALTIFLAECPGRISSLRTVVSTSLTQASPTTGETPSVNIPAHPRFNLPT